MGLRSWERSCMLYVRMGAVEIIPHIRGDEKEPTPFVEVIIDVGKPSSAEDFERRLRAAVIIDDDAVVSKDKKRKARLFNERVAGTSKQKRGLHENGTGYASDEAPLVKGGRRG